MEKKDNQNNWKRSQATNWLAFLSPLRFFRPIQVGGKQSYSKKKANEIKRTRIQAAWPSQANGKQR